LFLTHERQFFPSSGQLLDPFFHFFSFLRGSTLSSRRRPCFFGPFLNPIPLLLLRPFEEAIDGLGIHSLTPGLSLPIPRVLFFCSFLFVWMEAPFSSAPPGGGEGCSFSPPSGNCPIFFRSRGWPGRVFYPPRRPHFLSRQITGPFTFRDTAPSLVSLLWREGGLRRPSLLAKSITADSFFHQWRTPSSFLRWGTVLHFFLAPHSRFWLFFRAS